MGSAHTRKFFEKNLTKNFRPWVSANIGCSTVERRYYDKKYAPSFKVFERWGFGGRKAFFKKFSSPPKKHKNPQYRFFFGTRGAKKKLGKKKTPFLWAPPKPASFWKSLTKTFTLWYSANIGCSTVERGYYGKKIAPKFQSFWKMGVRRKKTFFKKFSSSVLNTI